MNPARNFMLGEVSLKLGAPLHRIRQFANSGAISSSGIGRYFIIATTDLLKVKEVLQAAGLLHNGEDATSEARN